MYDLQQLFRKEVYMHRLVLSALEKLNRLVSYSRYKLVFGLSPNNSNLLSAWKKSPSNSFHGYFAQKLKWKTIYGDLCMDYDDHGYSSMPDIRCQFPHRDFGLTIGWIEGISMVNGGVVLVRHFALATHLTHSGLGSHLLDGMIEQFKQMNAIAIEFHESHSNKLGSYRRFFDKNNIPEIKNGVWRMDLYPTGIPDKVREYQHSLKRPRPNIVENTIDTRFTLN